MDTDPKNASDSPASPAPGHTLLDLSVPTGPGQPGAAPRPEARAAGSGRSPAADAAAPKLGRYRIIKEHARGGMGRVLLAVDTTIGRNVAVKELLTGLLASASDSAATKSIGERFLREARVTGRLEHPNIVPVYEIGTSDAGALYYSMRFVGGRTLSQRLDEIHARAATDTEKLAARLQLLEAFQDMCNAVAYAHSRGVIHRDLKPSNVMLGEFGETVVLDWGLARTLTDDSSEPVASGGAATDVDSSQLTLDGTVVGTPAYMPPEQAAGDQQNIDELSDVYALGAVLYELLTGSPPYEGGSAHAILERVVNEAPRPVLERMPGVPRELAVLCARAMERDRAKRLPSALTLAQEIKAFRDGKTLASYEYSSLELLQRFLKRQWKLMGVIALALCVVGAIGAYAVSEIVSERNTAQSALARAKAEEDRRVEAEKLAEQREKDILDSRRAAIKRAEETLAGFDRATIVNDLFGRVADYGREKEALRLMDSDERARNRSVITAVLGYAAQLQELLRLRGDSADPRQLADLRVVQSALVELAIFNADFELADYLLSGSNLPDDEIASLAERNAKTRAALLAWRAQRINACLEDARLGLRRENRALGAPGLRAYVAELSAFQDEQTAKMFAAQLTRLRNEIAALKRPPKVIEFDQAELYCGVLGRLQRPLACVPALSDFLAAQVHPRLCASAANALADTQHPLGTQALIDAAKRRGLRLILDNRTALARAFLPAGLEEEHPAHAGLLRFARGDYEQAETCFGKAPKEPFVVLFRAMMHIEQGRRDDAQRELLALAQDQPESVHVLLALARAQDEGEAEATLNRAVALKPPSVDGMVDALVARCQFYFERDYIKALADIETALTLAPGRADLFQMRGDVMRVMGRLEDAIDCYNSAIEADPDNALAWIFKAESQRGLHGEFLPAALRAVELAPENSHAWAYLCQAYYFGSELDKAVEAGRKAVTFNAGEQEGWYYLGLSYLRMRVDGARGNEFFNARAGQPLEREHIEQAIEAFRGLHRANPLDFRSWALEGECLVALGRDVEAREVLGHAARIEFLNVNTINMGMSGVRRMLAILDVRTRAIGEPQSAGEHIDAALLEAYAASHEFEPERMRARLRSAISHLEQAHTLLGATRSRADQQRLRLVRVEIAAALLQGGFCHAIAEILQPALAGEPDWLAAPIELSIGEAQAALGLQYRDGQIAFLGRDAVDLARLEADFDSLTGVERKARGEMLVSKGLEALKAVAQRGYDLRVPFELPALRLLREDPRYLETKAAFDASRKRGENANPYSVVVISGIRPGTQAARLGLHPMDVIDSVNGQKVTTVAALRNAVANPNGGETYELVVRRYHRDASGALEYRKDANGKLLLDERQNPVAVYDLARFTPKFGMLGVNLEPGLLPHPLDS